MSDIGITEIVWRQKSRTIASLLFSYRVFPLLFSVFVTYFTTTQSCIHIFICVHVCVSVHKLSNTASCSSTKNLCVLKFFIFPLCFYFRACLLFLLCLAYGNCQIDHDFNLFCINCRQLIFITSKLVVKCTSIGERNCRCLWLSGFCSIFMTQMCVVWHF